MPNTILYNAGERKTVIAKLRREYGHPLATDQLDDLIPEAKTSDEVWARFNAPKPAVVRA